MKFLKLLFFKKGVRISASKSKALTILNMIEINHGSHLPQHSLPPNLFSSFPKHLFIFSLLNILLKELSSVLPILYTFPINQSTSRSFHLVWMLFFSFIKKKFHLFHPLLPPNFHTNFRKKFSIRFLLIFNILHTSLNLTLCFSLNSYYLDL